MRVLGPVIEVTRLPMHYAWKYDSFCCAAASKLVRDNHPWVPPRAVQELTKEPHSGKAVPLWLDQDIDQNAVLIDRPPKIMLHSVDGR